MKKSHSALLLATVASAVIASGAAAQTLIPFSPGQSSPSDPTNVGNASSVTSGSTSTLLGTGATSIQNVLRVECARIGSNSPEWTPGTTTAPAGSDRLQPYFACSYEGEGSGFGRQQWRNNSNQWPVAGLVNDRFVSVNGHVQFAFADSSINATDLTAFNDATNGVAAIAKKPIMFPKYVLPVAVAYNPVYGINASGAEMRFNNTIPVTLNGVAAGGIRLTRSLYCAIFNGTVRNWNNNGFAVNNNNKTLQDPVNDTADRWASRGVPIRLVGRMEKSGTTDIFTRALSAQCGTSGNRYTRNAETLPYNSASGVDFTAERPDTDLRPNGGTNAGATNSVGREYFNGTTIQVSANSSASAPTSYPSIYGVGSGLYLVAIGSGNVAAAIAADPDFTIGAVRLNGKIGYIASDFIANSSTGNPKLHAAALQSFAGGYQLPTGVNATNAMASIAPPQSTSTTTGAYNTADTRTNRLSATVDRADPFSWYDVLYPTATSGLATPAAGYPITGTTQFLGYQCYTQRNREHIVQLLGTETGVVTRDYANQPTNNAIRNIVINANIGNLPVSWSNAVTETFLKNSVQADANGSGTLGARNLWIQSRATPGGTANTTVCGTAGAGM